LRQPFALGWNSIRVITVVPLPNNEPNERVMADKNLDHDVELHAALPIPIKKQPDPFLQISTGKTSIGGMSLFALATIAILAVVLYGLNAPNDAASTRSAPPSSVAQSSAPAAGGQAAPTAPQTTNNAKG
jgi:hypothetical protein